MAELPKFPVLQEYFGGLFESICFSLAQTSLARITVTSTTPRVDFYVEFVFAYLLV